MTASVQASYVDMKRNESKSKAFRIDPTRTFTIRKAFVNESNRRFRLIKALIWDAIVTKDVLGLKEKKQKSISSVFHLADSGLQPKAFAFKTDPKKVESFMSWLNTELDTKILEVASPRKNVGNVAWANKYIDTAYKRGMKRAETELAKAGIPTSKLPDNVKWFAVEARFNLPIHADKVGLIYTRTYSDLKGITDTMSQEISRTLAQGMAEGRGPAYLARTLNNRIEQAGGDLAIVDPRGTVRMRAIDRARVLARTETIRAHHVGNINIYREAGIEGVMIQAEWSASGDELTCEDCMDLDGNVFPLDVIEGMIPYHPQCRCVAIPIVAGTEGYGSKLGIEDEVADVLPPVKVPAPVKVIPPPVPVSGLPPIKIKLPPGVKAGLPSKPPTVFPKIPEPIPQPTPAPVAKSKYEWKSLTADSSYEEKKEAWTRLKYRTPENVGASDELFLKWQNELGKEGYRMMEANPKLASLVEELGDRQFGGLTLYDKQYLGKKGRVTGCFIDEDKATKLAMKGWWKHSEVTIGGCNTGTSVFTTFRHEYGHKVWGMSGSVKREWISIYRDMGGNGSSKIGKAISSYAKLEHEEGFTEAFSAWTSPKYNEAVKKLPAEIEDFMVKHFR